MNFLTIARASLLLKKCSTSYLSYLNNLSLITGIIIYFI